MSLSNQIMMVKFKNQLKKNQKIISKKMKKKNKEVQVKHYHRMFKTMKKEQIINKEEFK